MSFRIRASRIADIGSLYELAKLTGGGFTNLPPDRDALAAKLARSAHAFAKEADTTGDDIYVLMLENSETGQVRGTAQVFSKIGQHWPFYSYRTGVLSQTSQELGRTFRAEMLTLTTDLEGSSEVGGLFLHPRERAGGLGLLLARSRYLFIRQHRRRFGDRVIAELRGVIDEAGGSPFWDGLAGKFFGMSFQEADQFNAVHGNQFIADLMPKHPIYTAMLPETARAVMGMPHPTGRAAMRMLEGEGFAHEGYIDIFDGGPSMAAATDQIRTVRDAADAKIVAIDAEGGQRALVSHGRLQDFVAIHAMIEERDGGIAISAESAALLGASVGDEVAYAVR
ncbi:arginine N-succinyltransferase [Sphingomonas oligoaromativorans]|uniref:arginine N-succinyltransferase n=1 Tax=Sphingomonas oligoaromativorans TaxID=575322 RepID=UPI001420288C|nr:arginine N-succinyltransferase [Sphingomonas oligoaromativorans]NIJ33589.1 arginine N-succinyltransferase [Sphingomonas oligoaromativorans]